MDIEEILKRRQPPTNTVRILLDQHLAIEFKEVEREETRARAAAERSNDRQVQIRAADLARRLDNLREQIEDARVTFRFAGIPRTAFNELLEAHPPRPEDIEQGFEMNPETFGPQIIAACAVEPEIPVEKAEQIWSDWTDAEVVRLFNAAYESNKVVRDVPFTGSVIGSRPSSDPPSGTAPSGE